MACNSLVLYGPLCCDRSALCMPLPAWLATAPCSLGGGSLSAMVLVVLKKGTRRMR